MSTFAEACTIIINVRGLACLHGRRATCTPQNTHLLVASYGYGVDRSDQRLFAQNEIVEAGCR